MSAALDISHEAEILPPGGFDYGALTPDVAAVARRAADTFRTAHKRIKADVIAAGEVLIAVKDHLEHGQFGAWLDAEFGAEARTARNYMQTARHFADKAEIISDLPLATVYKLAAPSTPDVVRENVVALVRSGDAVGAAKVNQMIGEAVEAERKHKAAEREKARRAKLSEAQRKAEGQKAKARERYERDKQRAFDTADRERHERNLELMRAARLIAEAVGPARDTIISHLEAIEAHSSTRWLLMALGAPHPNGSFLDKGLNLALDELKGSGPALPGEMGFDLIKHAWKKCSAQERARFVAWVKEGEE